MFRQGTLWLVIVCCLLVSCNQLEFASIATPSGPTVLPDESSPTSIAHMQAVSWDHRNHLWLEEDDVRLRTDQDVSSIYVEVNTRTEEVTFFLIYHVGERYWKSSSNEVAVTAAINQLGTVDVNGSCITMPVPFDYYYTRATHYAHVNVYVQELKRLCR